MSNQPTKTMSELTDEKLALPDGEPPIEFHVKQSEWDAMGEKTKEAIREMVLCAHNAAKEGKLKTS